MDEAGAKRAGLSRREMLAILGAGALVAEQALLTGSSSPASTATPGAASTSSRADVKPEPGGYAPDGTAGRAAALPLRDVTLLDSAFGQNQGRNTAPPRVRVRRHCFQMHRSTRAACLGVDDVHRGKFG